MMSVDSGKQVLYDMHWRKKSDTLLSHTVAQFLHPTLLCLVASLEDTLRKFCSENVSTWQNNYRYPVTIDLIMPVLWPRWNQGIV